MTPEFQQWQRNMQPTNDPQRRGAVVGTVGTILFMPGPKIEELNPAGVMFSQKSVMAWKRLWRA